jgi:4-hydroxy-4-methyl-2-oxoglutarate aldolase
MKMGTVIRTIPRAGATVIASLREHGVATVHEAMGRTGLMKPWMRPIYPGARIAGSAVTVLAHPGDNWMLHVAVEVCQRGDVLVVAISSGCTDGYFGELLATSLVSRGVCGLVIDAGCRDVAELTRMRFPVWSKAISAKGTIKATLGCVNIPVVCAGASVTPGDVVVADDDGVVIVPIVQAASVASTSDERAVREAAKRKRLAAGELNLDIENMRAKLASAGLVYYESLDEARQNEEKERS